MSKHKEKNINLKVISENEKIAQIKVKELVDHREKVLKGEIMEVEGWWQEIFINWLKQQAFIVIGDSLKELKKTGIKWAIDFSNWLLSELEQLIISLYRNANQEEKEIFKNKMVETFPNSPIIEKLN